MSLDPSLPVTSLVLPLCCRLHVLCFLTWFCTVSGGNFFNGHKVVRREQTVASHETIAIAASGDLEIGEAPFIAQDPPTQTNRTLASSDWSALQCERLRSAIAGDAVVCPVDGPLFTLALTVFNNGTNSTRTPFAVVEPRTDSELSASLAIMHQRFPDLSISVKNGGHQPAGWSLRGTVLLNLGRLRGISVDKADRIVRVAAGERWGEVYRAVTEQGFVVHGATDHGTGVAGVTMVGGITLLSKTLGLVANTLSSARLCLMNGTILSLSENSNPRVFHLLRTGAGMAALPVGVLTELTFQLFAAQDQYLAFQTRLPQADFTTALDTLAAFWALKQKILDVRLAVDVSLVFGTVPTLIVYVLFNGPFDEGANVSEPICKFLGVAPEPVPTYEQWTRSLTFSGMNMKIHNWRGTFVAEPLVSQIIAKLHAWDAHSTEQMGQMFFEDRVRPAGTSHVGETLVSILCSEPECHSAQWAEDLYDLVLPSNTAEYLGYMSSSSHRSFDPVLRHWTPNALPALRCWRATLGADTLVGGATSVGDVEVWRRNADLVRRNIAALQGSQHIAGCNAAAMWEDPASWCDGGEQGLPFLGSSALVLGGTGGIGKEVVRLLSAKGAEVFVTARDVKACETMAMAAWDVSGVVHCEVVDLAQRDSVLALAARLFTPTGPNFLVHAAAGQNNESLWVGHLSMVLLSQKLLQQRPDAHVIAIGSGASEIASNDDVDSILRHGHDAFAGQPFQEYAATKRAQMLALQWLRREKAARVTVVIPTVTVETNLVRQLEQDMPKSMRSAISFGSAELVAMQVVNAALMDAGDVERQACFSGCAELPCYFPFAEQRNAWKQSVELIGMSFDSWSIPLPLGALLVLGLVALLSALAYTWSNAEAFGFGRKQSAR